MDLGGTSPLGLGLGNCSVYGSNLVGSHEVLDLEDPEPPIPLNGTDEMADRIVADLGVANTVAHVRPVVIFRQLYTWAYLCTLSSQVAICTLRNACTMPNFFKLRAFTYVNRSNVQRILTLISTL